MGDWLTLLYDESSYEFCRNIYLLTDGKLMPQLWNIFAGLHNLFHPNYIFVFKHKWIDKFHNIGMKITITHFICLAPTKEIWCLFVVYLCGFGNNTCIPWLSAWKYCEFVPISGKTQNLHLNVHCAFFSTYSMVTNCMHLKVHSRGGRSIKDTGLPRSGACKYCKFSGKAEYAMVCIHRCSIKDTGSPS